MPKTCKICNATCRGKHSLCRAHYTERAKDYPRKWTDAQRQEHSRIAAAIRRGKREPIKPDTTRYRSSGGVRLHRIEAARVLGRPLKTTEHVHHINGDPLDNRHCNLIICTNSYHRTIHNKAAKAYGRLIMEGKQ